MLKNLATLFTILILAIPATFAMEGDVPEQEDKPINPKNFLSLLKYAHDRKDSESNDPLYSEFDVDKDKPYLTKDGRVYILKDGKKHMLRGFRYGQSGVDKETNQPIMIQGYTPTYMLFNCVWDSQKSQVKRDITVYCNGLKIHAKYEDGTDVEEYFYTSEATLPGGKFSLFPRESITAK